MDVMMAEYIAVQKHQKLGRNRDWLNAAKTPKLVDTTHAATFAKLPQCNQSRGGMICMREHNLARAK
jgi:hypothetical protein